MEINKSVRVQHLKKKSQREQKTNLWARVSRWEEEEDNMTEEKELEAHSLLSDEILSLIFFVQFSEVF